eukprot:gene5695-9515_t
MFPKSKQDSYQTINDCRKSIEFDLKNNEKVKKLANSISNLDPNVLKNGFKCKICKSENTERGYYDGNKQVVTLCVNKLKDKKNTTEVLIHELVHAYDSMKYKKVYCKTRACMEIRSYNISGICSKQKYLFGSAYGDKHFSTLKECLKYHAFLSTKNYCSQTSEKDIDSVFDQCSNDFRPIEEDARISQMNGKQPYNPDNLSYKDKVTKN